MKQLAILPPLEDIYPGDLWDVRDHNKYNISSHHYYYRKLAALFYFK